MGRTRPLLFIALIGALLTTRATAQPAAEYLVPANTKGFVSVPNVQRLQQAWDQIELGKLAADPVVKPFIEDLERQIRARLDRTGVRVGINLEDLLDICAGEVALAFMEPESGHQKHAVAAIADVTGKDEAVTNLLASVKKNMAERKAELTERTVEGTKLQIYTVPIKKGARTTFKAVVFVTDNRLVAVDHEQIALQMLQIIKGSKLPLLANQPAFVKVRERCQQEAAGLAPHVVWFAEPIGYAKVAREAAAVQKRRRNDILDALSKQGFEAVQGMGGFLNLDAGDFQLLHRSYVYAPADPGNGQDRFELAARMLDYPGDETLEVEAWVPETVNSYATATWQIQEAYRYIGSLVDEVAGEPGFFDDLKASLEEDPAGPQINLDKDIVAHLGERVSIMTDTKVPIDEQSERFIVAISLLDPAAMKKSVKQALETDPEARLRVIDGHDIWEIINEDVEAPVVSVDAGDGFGPFDGFEEEEAAPDEMAPLMSNAAISVVHGHLMISSHVEFIVEIMRHDQQQVPNLAESADYQAVQKALQALGGTKQDTLRLFSRADEEFHASYELIRKGLMPESKGLLGQILNQVLGPKEKGVVREQKIDGDKMPDYQVVRRYLGPVGAFVQTEEDGWYSAAVGLAKETPQEPNIDSTVSTADRAAAEAK